MQAIRKAARVLVDMVVVATLPVIETGAALGGAALMAYGASEIYRPAGFIVGGVLLLAGAWIIGKGAN